MPPALIARPAFHSAPRAGVATALVVLAFAALLGACSKSAPEPVAAVQPSTVSDGEVTAAVRSLLDGDAQTKAFAITVSTSAGEVSLNGTLDTQVQIDHALALTRATAGVRSVKDGLVLKPS
ncbi:BON domain-containing protein [Pseudaquabacterium pictum]|uniref:BON domain-containing protein n=1 Tax=Pseudaquabacterium pictum TaxID=2315236 RepID=A0A480AN83_9BURK|nr:BON domain-containing protein [Rubrivivax pictus]GCL61817.1 hypothetical protein AQPW35_08980 [Rubrivivax pictus]